MAKSKDVLFVHIDPKMKNKFRTYCRRQDVTMKKGITALVEQAVSKNVPIKTEVKM